MHIKKILLIILFSLPVFGQVGDVYISPSGNDTSGNGTVGAPYLTWAKAASAIDALMAGGSGCLSGRTIPFTVVARGGYYFQSQGTNTVYAFTSADDGCSQTLPVQYINYPGEYPIFSGGLPLSGWTNNGTACVGNSCTEYILQFASNPTYFETLWYQQKYSFTSFSCTSNIVTAVLNRATELYIGAPFQLLGSLGYDSVGYKVLTITTTTNTNDTITFGVNNNCANPNQTAGLVYFNMRRWRPRWSSNSSLLGQDYNMIQVNFGAAQTNCINNGSNVYVCGDRIGVNTADISGLPTTNIAQTANTGNTGGYSGGSCNGISNNYPAGDMEVLMLNNSQSPIMRVGCIDFTNDIMYFMNTVYIPYTSYNSAVVPVGNGASGSNNYIIENVRYPHGSEIPCTFFLDRSTTLWTLHYYTCTANENPNSVNDSIIIPQMSNIISANNVQDVNFQGLIFLHANWTPGTTGYPDSRSGMLMSYSAPVYTNSGITAAISFLNSNYTNWYRNVIGESDGVGIEFWTSNTGLTTHNHIIQNDAYYDLGSGGIRLGMVSNTSCSGCPGNTDTDANIPYNTVLNNILIDGIGRIVPSAFATMDGDVRNNMWSYIDIYDSYHGAINICALNCILGPIGSTWHGTSFNIFKFVQCQFLSRSIMSDGIGCPYINIGNPNSPYAQGFGTVIDSDYIHNVSAPNAGEGFYFDNFSSGTFLTNSICAYVSDNCFWLTGGPQASGIPVITNNNVFAYAINGLHGHGSSTWYASTPTTIWQQVIHKGDIFVMDRIYPNYTLQRACSSLYISQTGATNYIQYEFWDYNTYYNPTENFASDTHAFHVQTSQGACSNGIGSWTFGTFANWQSTTNTFWPSSIVTAEDVHGQVANPGFQTIGPCNGTTFSFNPTMTSAPITGFNYTAINTTFATAGRLNPINFPNIPIIPTTLPSVADYTCSSY